MKSHQRVESKNIKHNSLIIMSVLRFILFSFLFKYSGPYCRLRERYNELSKVCFLGTFCCRCRYFTEDEFSVQSCSECLRNIPHVLFKQNQNTVNNKTEPLLLSLLVLRAEKLDIFNPIDHTVLSSLSFQFSKAFK